MRPALAPSANACRGERGPSPERGSPAIRALSLLSSRGLARLLGFYSPRTLRRALGAGFGLATLTIGAPAAGFERQWHLGASVTGVAPSAGRERGAGAGLLLAYGVSDVFDVRAELRSSVHPATNEAAGFGLHLGALGLAYKLDVLEWIPYFGVRGGYYLQSGEPGPFARHGGTLGGFAGLDHAFSRSFAAGVELGVDRFLPDGASSMLALRAEYRWGY